MYIAQWVALRQNVPVGILCACIPVKVTPLLVLNPYYSRFAVDPFFFLTALLEYPQAVCSKSYLNWNKKLHLKLQINIHLSTLVLNVHNCLEGWQRALSTSAYPKFAKFRILFNTRFWIFNGCVWYYDKWYKFFVIILTQTNNIFCISFSFP